MASLKKEQSETMATVDTAKAMIDKVLTIMEIMVTIPSQSTTISTNPIDFLIQLLEHAGVTYEDLKLWLTDFLIYVVPAMEIGVKTVLLTNLKNMVSCSVDPRIPEKYRKRHKGINERNTPNEYGIDINVESIDYLDKMSVSPLSDYGRNMYFGLYGVNDVYSFARADDFDAFLWFVIHKGKFPMAGEVSTDLHEFNDRIHGNGNFSVYGNSLLDELHLIPEDGSSSSILPGNTFCYKDANSGPNIVSMCIDAFRKNNNEILLNILVPVSDDLTSVNWYVRRKDQLGANIFGSYAAAKAEKTEYVDKKGRKREKTTGSSTKNKTRDYSKEKAICNLQYIDSAYGDQEITGLANNKIRFTILPKPLVHIPNIAEGEPPWRFKRMLFDAEGNYDPNGKYTISIDDDDKLTYLDGAIAIDAKSGSVTVTNKEKVMKNLIECYPGLTVYEFNYDYVMGLKLFDAKVLASTLLQTLVNTSVGINLSICQKHQEATEKIKTIIKQIVSADDTETNECFFTFDNSKYDELLRSAELKRAKRQAFGNVTKEAGVFDSVNDILKEYDSVTEIHEKKDILSRAINQAAVSLSEGSDEKDRYNVEYSFVFDLIENLILAMMNAIMTPKVLMLLEVNQRIMGGTWEKFTLEDLLKAMTGVINAMAKELRDLLIQELLKLLWNTLQPIIEILGSIIARERLEYYAEVIENIIKNCPMIWFSFGNQDLETKLDTVDYADIDVSTTRAGEQPNTNKC